MSKPIISVVDDNESVRETITMMLISRIDVDVLEFSSGQEFLNAYNKDISCLILDLRMPGLSGWEVLRRMSESGISLPTILISGHMDEVPEENELPDFVETFFSKPFNTMKMINLIKEVLER